MATRTTALRLALLLAGLIGALGGAESSLAHDYVRIFSQYQGANTIVVDCRKLLAGFMRGNPTASLGIQGLIEMLIFMALLLTGFFYIIKKGALKWE